MTSTPALPLGTEATAMTPTQPPSIAKETRDRLREAAEKATPGPWHHCQPYVTLPASNTVHGRVPAERVDYVSTWPDKGTPPGHRTIIDMPGREARTTSNNMAFIALANPATILSLLAALEAAEAREAALEEGLKDAIDDYCTSAHAHHRDGCADVDNYANVKRWRALLSTPNASPVPPLPATKEEC